MSQDPEISIYTDGGANPNPGPGGWGVVLIDEATGKRRELSGGAARTTNNRMELTAAIEALEALKQPCRIRLFTDSQYLRRGITEWLQSWKRRGWKRREGEVINLDLWKRLDAVAARHSIDWRWVKGHAGNRYNERADALAAAQVQRQQSGVQEGAGADYQVFLKVTCVDGRGAWAAQVVNAGEERTLSGRDSGTTANRLCLSAAAEVLASLPRRSTVAVHTTNDYLRKGSGQWLAGWRRRNWKTHDGQPVKNAADWRRLATELSRRQVLWPAPGEEAAARIKQLAAVTRETLPAK